MSIRSLSYFLVAAEELNFTIAAQKLHITQQTLSSHIKRLEEQYGVVLFERRPRLRITPAGERMVHYASRIIRLERMMNAEFVDFSKKNGGVLVVGCSRIRAKHVLPEIWKTYQTLCPNIEIRMIEGNSSTLDEHMLSRKIDLCITLNTADQMHYKKEVLINERLYLVISAPLFEQCFGLAAEERYHSFCQGVQCSDILGIPLILQPPTNYIRRIIDRQFASVDGIPRSIFETNDSEMIFNMAASGCGASLLPDANLFPILELNKQMMQNIYIFPYDCLEIPIVIAYPLDMTLPHYEQVFMEVCKDVFSNLYHNISDRKRSYFSQQSYLSI